MDLSAHSFRLGADKREAVTYVALEPLQLGRVELLVLVEPVDIVMDLLDRLIDLLPVSGFVGHLGLQHRHVETSQLKLSGCFLLLLQLPRYVDRAVQIDDLSFHLGQRRLQPVQRLLFVLRGRDCRLDDDTTVLPGGRKWRFSDVFQVPSFSGRCKKGIEEISFSF